ncbi:DUF6236 family protein [Streptomyces sp. NPDC057611]|uniref:DUF6236 family protein n=1 Tax=Streptomyces sp. NPDC057611 TaxID=3346182 RepID=UPI0036CCEDFD
MSIGLYYPYVHFRDLAWLKAAALYMPQLVRVVPQGFRVSDHRDVRALRDGLGFVEDFDPADAVEAASEHVLALLNAHGEELRHAFGVSGGQDVRAAGSVNAEPSPPGVPAQGIRPHHAHRFDERPLAGLYPGEMVAALRESLLDSGLAVPTIRNSVNRQSGPEWLGMDPALAWVYKCALTAEVASRTAFMPLTDQVAAHTAADLWDADRMAAVLLGEAGAPTESHDLTGRVGVLSIRYVLPARLATVPADKIVELRKRHEPEFLAYSEAVERTAKTLRETVGDIPSRQALDIHLRDAVHRDFETEVDALRKAMNGIGLQTITTAVSAKFEMPTSVALTSAAGVAVAGAMMGTLTGVAGTAAVAAFGVITGARRQAAQAMAANPASFLLRVERGLTPTTLWKRVSGTLRRNLGADV